MKTVHLHAKDDPSMLASGIGRAACFRNCPFAGGTIIKQNDGRSRYNQDQEVYEQSVIMPKTNGRGCIPSWSPVSP